MGKFLVASDHVHFCLFKDLFYVSIDHDIKISEESPYQRGVKGGLKITFTTNLRLNHESQLNL